MKFVKGQAPYGFFGSIVAVLKGLSEMTPVITPWPSDEAPDMTKNWQMIPVVKTLVGEFLAIEETVTVKTQANYNKAFTEAYIRELRNPPEALLPIWNDGNAGNKVRECLEACAKDPSGEDIPISSMMLLHYIMAAYWNYDRYSKTCAALGIQEFSELPEITYMLLRIEADRGILKQIIKKYR